MASKMMRRSQIQSQVLVYVLAVITMGMILLFGFQVIMGMKERAEMTKLIQFRSTIKTDIISIGMDYGTSKQKSYAPPANYRQICFVNLEYAELGKNEVNLRFQEKSEETQDLLGRNAYGILSDAIRDMVSENAARKNLFLCPPCTMQEYVGNITLTDKDGADTAFMCFPVANGKVTFRVTGLGDEAQISPQP